MSTAIRVAVGLPVRSAGADPDVVLTWAVRAEHGPFSGLAVPDRVVHDALEPLVALAAAAAVTRRIGLLTSIVLGPTRETTLLARQAASVDVLSRGRLTLGVGIGIRPDDYTATGTDFATRGRRLDAQLPLLRRIWAGEPLDSGAEPVDPGIGMIGPAPARPGGPQVLVGGYVDAVARRIAAWGDGFMAPGGGDPERMAALWRAIVDAWDAAGRAGRPRRVAGSYFALGPRAEEAARAHIDAWYGFDPALAERRLRGIPTTVEAVSAVIRRHEDDGADELVLRPCVADLDQLDRLTDLV
ncbi:MAG TPA: LLM class flavin-dependent oxidoreductase, partial [Candidatus Limnocylindrales bacterium]|nr:LLM class flavin-dependent oxidoreductase [Candidatus Limnocylindrales bacterium]